MRKVELLPTRDCEAGYGPDDNAKSLCFQKPVDIKKSTRKKNYLIFKVEV